MMGKSKANCFICNRIPDVPEYPETPADPKLISRAKNLFILLQRALDLCDLPSNQSGIAHQISFCKLCFDGLEVFKTVLDAFDNLKKIAERHKTEIQSKFLASKGQDSDAKSSKDVGLQDVAELRSQMVAGLRARSTAMTGSSKTPGVFKPVMRTSTKISHFTGQPTPASSQRIAPLPNLEISSSSKHRQAIQNCEMNGEDDVLNDVSNESSCLDDFASDQSALSAPTPPPSTNAGSSGIKETKVSVEFDHPNQQLSPEKNTKPANSPCHPSNKPQTKPPVKNEKKHKCQSCPAKFKTKYCLTRHFRIIHIGEKPFSCNLCPKMCTTRSNLKVHQRIHGVGKPISCKFCSKVCTTSSELEVHERVHTGEKPYVCNFCYQAFSQPSSLVRHTRLHTGEKPFQCTICSKEFKQLRSLKAHKKAQGHTQ